MFTDRETAEGELCRMRHKGRAFFVFRQELSCFFQRGNHSLFGKGNSHRVIGIGNPQSFKVRTDQLTDSFFAQMNRIIRIELSVFIENSLFHDGVLPCAGTVRAQIRCLRFSDIKTGCQEITVRTAEPALDRTDRTADIRIAVLILTDKQILRALAVKHVGGIAFLTAGIQLPAL